MNDNFEQFSLSFIIVQIRFSYLAYSLQVGEITLLRIISSALF